MEENSLNFSDITERIKEVIAGHQMTPKAFAEKVGENPSKLSHIFSGRNNPSLALVLKICRAFPDVQVNWLLGFNDNEESQSYMPSQQSVVNGVIDFSEKESPKEPNVAAEPEQKPVADEFKPLVKPKAIKKIIVFYSDNTFDEVVKADGGE
ncbi:MAG: helix-turn-helix transcriptional regulator [Paludibacteraceae bacterium]|nr:helix-turn-helix transcriptional regulator [Paludibacteraceae bacterium]